MSYPVRLVGGTDRVQPNPPNGRFYEVGEPITDMSDETRLHLQTNGVRFETIHEDTGPMPTEVSAAPILPPDQAALNDEIAAEKPKGDAKSATKRGDA